MNFINFIERTHFQNNSTSRNSSGDFASTITGNMVSRNIENVNTSFNQLMGVTGRIQPHAQPLSTVGSSSPHSPSPSSSTRPLLPQLSTNPLTSPAIHQTINLPDDISNDQPILTSLNNPVNYKSIDMPNRVNFNLQPGTMTVSPISPETSSFSQQFSSPIGSPFDTPHNNNSPYNLSQIKLRQYLSGPSQTPSAMSSNTVTDTTNSSNATPTNTPPPSGPTSITNNNRPYYRDWSIQPKILIVDNDTATTRESSQFLQFYRCHCDVAADRITAVNKLQAQQYDLVLMVLYYITLCTYIYYFY